MNKLYQNPQLVEVIELERYGRRTPVNCVISVVSQRARRSIVYGYFASAAVAVDSSHMTASLSDLWSRPNPSYYCGGMYPKKHTGLFVVHTLNFFKFLKVMDLLHVNKNVSHMSLHHSRLNGNVATLSREGEV